MKRINITDLLIGSDPEFPLYNKNTGEWVSAENLIGGDKHNPQPISDKGHAVQEDGVALELTFPPSNDPYKFKEDLDFILNFIRNKHKDLEIGFTPAAEYNLKYLQSEQATTVGCSTDYDVWDVRVATVPNYKTSRLRYMGGHLHVGYPEPNRESTENLVKAFDVFLGVPSVLADRDEIRKRLYGSAGRFRPKPYGVEYRSLSNYWLKDLKTIRWVFGNTKEAVLFLNNGNRVAAEDKKWIQKCMIENDKELAEDIIANYGVMVPENILAVA